MLEKKLKEGVILMAKKKCLGKKHCFEFLLDDREGNRYLTHKRYYYSMSDAEYEDLMRVVTAEGRYKSESAYVMQTYDGLVSEAITKMAELMVSDIVYREAMLSSIKAIHKEVRALTKNKENILDSDDVKHYKEALVGLNYCVPVVEAFFEAPISKKDREDVIFNLANVLRLINNKYHQLIVCAECIDSENEFDIY